MPTPCQQDKFRIRKEMLKLRRGLSPEVRAVAAAAACGEILSRPEVRAMLAVADAERAIAVYLASPHELELAEAIREMLRCGVKVAAPRWDGERYQLARLVSLRPDDLRQGPMGIFEPREGDLTSPSSVAVWIVPGLAFTPQGERLGYGGGWYDRLMAVASPQAFKLGVAYDFQLLPHLPCEAHDLRVDHVVTAPTSQRLVSSCSGWGAGRR